MNIFPVLVATILEVAIFGIVVFLGWRLKMYEHSGLRVSPEGMLWRESGGSDTPVSTMRDIPSGARLHPSLNASTWQEIQTLARELKDHATPDQS